MLPNMIGYHCDYRYWPYTSGRSVGLYTGECVVDVNAALSAVQPMVNNYFGGVLEGLMGCLSLTAPPGDEAARSTQEGVERRVAEALEKNLPPTAKKSGDPPQGLHVGYKLDFFQRDSVPLVPALSSTALPDLLKAMDRLRLQVPPVPNKARSLLGGETLLDKVNSESKDPEREEVEVHLMSELLYSYERTPKVRGMRRCSALPNKAARIGGSAGASEASNSSNGASRQEPSVPPGQADSIEKDPSRPPLAGDRKRKIASLKEDVNRQKDRLPQVLIGGITIDHDKNSMLTTLSLAKKEASNPVRSLEDDTDEQDEPASKVTKVTFASDDDLSSPLPKGMPSASESQPNGKDSGKGDDPDGEPDEDENDDDEPTDVDEEKAQKDLTEDDESSSCSEGADGDDVLEEPPEVLSANEEPDYIANRLQMRINLYSGDKMVANRVRCSILNLKRNADEPTRKEIETSPIFKIRGPKEGDKSISNIAAHWISVLAHSNVLGDRHPNAFKPPDGWPKIYSWETFKAQAPEVVSKLWRNKRGLPLIVVIIPPEESEFRKSYFLNRLHKISSIKRVSVYFQGEKTTNKIVNRSVSVVIVESSP